MPADSHRDEALARVGASLLAGATVVGVRVSVREIRLGLRCSTVFTGTIRKKTKNKHATFVYSTAPRTV